MPDVAAKARSHPPVPQGGGEGRAGIAKSSGFTA
jgi:hypothetical protein